MARRSRRTFVGVVALLALGLAVRPRFTSKQRSDGAQADRSPITQASLKRQIRKGLRFGANGSTEAETITFLRKIGVQTETSSYSNRGVVSTDGFEPADPNGRTLGAAVPDIYHGFLTTGGIYMKFGFNAKGRLTRYDMRDVYTGL